MRIGKPFYKCDIDYRSLLTCPVSYSTSLSPRQTVNAFNDGRWDLDEAVRKGDELIGWNSMDISGKFRPVSSRGAYWDAELC